jgi:hypothetical protein
MEADEMKKHFLEVSVSVKVLEKQDKNDYQGRWIDGHTSTGWILCPKQIETIKLHHSWRLKELISVFADQYELLPDDPKEEKKFWESVE